MNSRIAAMYGKLAKVLTELDAAGEDVGVDAGDLFGIEGLSGYVTYDVNTESWYFCER